MPSGSGCTGTSPCPNWWNWDSSSRSRRGSSDGSRPWASDIVRCSETRARASSRRSSRILPVRDGEMRARADRARLFFTAAAVLLGCGALAARPAGGPTTWAGLPDISLIVVVVVGMIGVTAPVPSQYENVLGRVRWFAAVVLGVAAFAAARLLTAPIGPPVTAL